MTAERDGGEATRRSVTAAVTRRVRYKTATRLMAWANNLDLAMLVHDVLVQYATN